MSKKQNYFIVMDFDGTLAATFKDSRNGMNVTKASRQAVLDVFGNEGLRRYQEIGELNSREPGELTQLLLEGMGKEARSLSAEDLTEHYVEAKLGYLTSEITTEWPQLYPGAREFFKAS